MKNLMNLKTVIIKANNRKNRMDKKIYKANKVKKKTNTTVKETNNIISNSNKKIKTNISSKFHPTITISTVIITVADNKITNINSILI